MARTSGDGDVILEVGFDSRGVQRGIATTEKGVDRLGNSFKRLGAIAATAFSVVALINFGKESVIASNKVENSMKGLQSILEGQGRSFGKAKKFLGEYIKDGLIPMSDATTAYKNLAMRGYDDTQIQKVMEAFKNSSAYGRQASLSMGEAVSSASEGIKNENSILVDNAGVTKNVSMMWKDYAKSIGVGVDSLTKQQKIQAEVNGIIEETRFQMGDAAKVSTTFSGAVSKLQFGVNEMKVAFGDFIKPIATAVIPIINMAVTALKNLFTVMAQVSSLLFKKNVSFTEQVKEQESSIAGSVDGQEELTGAVKDTAKAQKNSLAFFDDIHTLAEETAAETGDSGVGGGVGSSGEASGTPTPDTGEIEVFSEKIKGFVDRIMGWFEPLGKISFDNLKNSLDNVKTSLEPFSEHIFKGLEWGIKNVFNPFAEWTITDYLPAWLNNLAATLDWLDSVLRAVSPIFISVWGNFFKPIAEWTGGKLVDWLNFLTAELEKVSAWIKGNQEKFEAFGEKLGEALGKVWEFFEPILDAGWEAFKNILSTINDVFLDISDAVLGFGIKMLDAWLAVQAFLESIGVWEFIQVAFETLVTNIGNAFALIVEVVGAVITGVIENLGFLMDFIKAVFTGDWKAAWNAVSNIFKGIGETIKKIAIAIWNNISTAFKTFATNFDGVWQGLWKGVGNFFIDIWNGVVSAFETAINWIINGINTVIEAINTMTGFASGLLEKIGIDIELSIGSIPNVSFSKIPRLATGTVVPPNRQFLAMLGDNTSEHEIVSPLSTMVAAFKQAMAEGNVSGGMRPLNVQLVLDGRELGRAVVEVSNEETQRVGTNLILGV